MNEVCGLFLRKNTVFIQPLYWNEKLYPVFGEPVIRCEPTVDALSTGILDCLKLSGRKEIKELEVLLNRKPRLLHVLAGVKSEKQFQQGTSHCVVRQTDTNFVVSWLFPAKDKKGFEGYAHSPKMEWALDDVDGMVVRILRHLTDSNTCYPHLAI